jgi:hypothetical protein
MGAATPEFRKPVMTLVEVSWQDPSGAWQTVPARMEDKSSGGACIRVKTPIPVGAKLRIQWRLENFSGTAKYCRGEGREYLVGIQRDLAESPNPTRAAPAPVLPQKSLNSGGLPVSTIETQSLPETEPIGIPEAARNVKIPAGHVASAMSEMPATEPAHRNLGNSSEEENRPGARDFRALRGSGLPTQPPSQRAVKERKSMPSKWLDLPWSKKPKPLRADGPEIGGVESDVESNAKNDEENLMALVDQTTETIPVHAAREVPTFRVQLSSMEDIYRAAGIMIPRKGYSIRKVVDMLNSAHMSGLSKEMKRVALLMALDAAGVPVDEVLQDAKTRQQALDVYEAAQRKQVEAEWARKAEEVVQIQAELESIKAHYAARISRSLEGVAREKATFNAWLTLKQQESQSMAEAAELCMKASIDEEARATPEVNMAKAAAASSGGARQESRSDAIH